MTMAADHARCLVCLGRQLMEEPSADVVAEVLRAVRTCWNAYVRSRHR